MVKWIKVETQLPELNEEVEFKNCYTSDDILLYDPSIGIHIGYCKKWNFDEVPEFELLHAVKFSLRINPTHWAKINVPDE